MALAAAAVVAGGLLSACGESGKPVLNWYINPDGQDTLTQLAADCSTDDYDIQIQLLPTGATDQRTQLARRLAASDSATNLMSLDPVRVHAHVRGVDEASADLVLDGSPTTTLVSAIRHRDLEEEEEEEEET